jgi:putative sterol carrier protein
MPARPPPDVTPTQFFETWLPSQVKAAAARPITVRVRLDGDGGGVWDLALGESGLTVIPGGGKGEAEVTLTQTVADWRAIVAGEPGAVNLAPPQASPADILFLDRTAQQVLDAVKGTVRFEVTGYNGRTWALVAKLGPGPTPEAADATISVDAETYAAMLARTLPPAAAYFQGKVKIAGDPNLAMQLGMALMPRYA